MKSLHNQHHTVGQVSLHLLHMCSAHLHHAWPEQTHADFDMKKAKLGLPLIRDACTGQRSDAGVTGALGKPICTACMHGPHLWIPDVHSLTVSTVQCGEDDQDIGMCRGCNTWHGKQLMRSQAQPRCLGLKCWSKVSSPLTEPSNEASASSRAVAIQTPGTASSCQNA